MTQEAFKQWKRWWFETVPQCHTFVCCHELTTCGVELQCGDCTIYPTWKFFGEGREHFTCTDVDCSDCLRNHECLKERNKENYDRKTDYNLSLF